MNSLEYLLNVATFAIVVVIVVAILAGLVAACGTAVL